MTMKPLHTLTRFQRGFMPFSLEHLDGALSTALYHHICVLAQAIYELGIEPILVWRETRLAQELAYRGGDM